MENDFAKNLAYFSLMRDEWLRAGLDGKWVTIAEEKLVGHFDTPAAAYSAGVAARSGKQDFIIKMVTAEELPKSTPALLVGAICVNR